MARFGSSRARSGGHTRSLGQSRYGVPCVISRGAGRRAGDARVRPYAPPEGDDLAPVALRDLAEHSQPMDVRREDADDDRLLRARDDRVERLTDARFAPRRPDGVDVRRVAEQEPDALARELLEARDIEALAVGRRLVELEVARVDDQARIGPDGERGRVGDRVRDPDGLHFEGPDLRAAPGLHLAQVDVSEDLVLARAFAHEAERVPPAVHRHVEPP